jgi:hypothetical protein
MYVTTADYVECRSDQGGILLLITITNYQLPITKWPHQSEAPVGAFQSHYWNVNLHTGAASHAWGLCSVLPAVQNG